MTLHATTTFAITGPTKHFATVQLLSLVRAIAAQQTGVPLPTTRLAQSHQHATKRKAETERAI